MTAKERWVLARKALESLSETEVAYIAALFDGEGSIGLYEVWTNRKYANILVRLTICNTAPELFEWLIPRLPGAHVYWQHPDTLVRAGRNRSCGRLTFDGVKAAALCERMVKYLTIKKRKAELVLKFYEGNNHERGIPVSEEEKERRRSVLREFSVELEKGRDAPRASWPSHKVM